MKKILSILFVSLVILSSYAQTEAGFLKDAKNNFVKVSTSSTKLKWSAFPPDTIIDFSVNVGGTDEPFTSLLTEIKSYWTLEEAAGNAIDSVETVDLPVFGTIGRQQAGKLGDCYSFATDGYLGNIDTYYEFTGSFSVGCWVKGTHASYSGLMSNYYVSGADSWGWDLSQRTDGRVQWSLRAPGNNTSINGVNVLNDNAWHYVLCSYNSVDDTMKIWRDGILETKGVHSGITYNANNRFSIGRRGTITYHTGLIDEPAAWNKELTREEVDSLYTNEVQYPFLTQGGGGDSLQLTTLGYDPRVDSVIINWEYDGDGWPTDEEDGTVKFAFPASDTTLYHDTIFPWPGVKDTIVRWTAWSGLNDVWTVVPNKDTVFIDSSDITPPPQDYPAIWDTIWYLDFEEYESPVNYTFDLQSPDWFNHGWFDSDHRWPAGWATNPIIRDSIVLDPKTNSMVLKYGYDDAVIDGYDGQTPARGGEGALVRIGMEPKEVYFSYNMMLRPGWLASGGGKFPGMGGGTNDYGAGCPPLPTDVLCGFKLDLFWHWPTNWDGNNWYNSVGGYGKYLNMATSQCPASEVVVWDDFMPVGPNLQYHDPPSNAFYFDVSDSIWYNITIRYVVNTFTGGVPNYDGLYEGYINGRLIFRKTGLLLLGPRDEGKGVNTIWWRHFYGGGGPPLRDEWSFFDDIIIFTYDESVDVPRGNEISPPGRVLNLPNYPKPVQE